MKKLLKEKQKKKTENNDIMVEKDEKPEVKQPDEDASIPDITKE